MKPASNLDLWGMPLELAVGLIGLGGAILGAAVAAGATVWVARWQARQALRDRRMDALEQEVAVLHSTVFRLGAWSMVDEPDEAEQWRAQMFASFGMCMARAEATGFPYFRKMVQELSTSETFGRTDDSQEGRQALRDAYMALYRLTGWWLAGPERFEAEQPSVERMRTKEIPWTPPQ